MVRVGEVVKCEAQSNGQARYRGHAFTRLGVDWSTAARLERFQTEASLEIFHD